MKHYEAPIVDVLSLAPCDVITSSFGGDTPIEDEEW